MRGFFRRRAPEASKPADSAAVQRNRDKPLLVLIVDDSPTETHIFLNALTKAGFEVETASNGEEGVALANRLHPDLILMDVVMPVLNGFQATRQLRRDPKTADIPIIIITTKDQDTDRMWGMRQGALDYLVKPVDPADLVQRVRVAIGE
jgi:twitching motility two-component system response regulator PilH